MNDDNLRTPTSDEAREIGQKGGIASGEARRIKSRKRQLLLDLLELRQPDEKIIADLQRYGVDTEDLTNEVALHLRQIDKAIRKGDTNAYREILKAAGILQEEINLGTRDRAAMQIVVGTPEAAEGLRRALETGAQPAPPENEDGEE